MHLLEAGVNLIYFRDILGHVSVTITEAYAKTNPRAKAQVPDRDSTTYSTGEKHTAEEKDDLGQMAKTYENRWNKRSSDGGSTWLSRTMNPSSCSKTIGFARLEMKSARNTVPK